MNKWYPEDWRFRIEVVQVGDENRPEECRMGLEPGGDTFGASYGTPADFCPTSFVKVSPSLEVVRCGGDLRNLGGTGSSEITFTCPDGVVLVRLNGEGRRSRRAAVRCGLPGCIHRPTKSCVNWAPSVAREDRRGREMPLRQAGPSDARRLAEIHIGLWQSAYRRSISDRVLDNLSVERRREDWEAKFDEGTYQVLVFERERRVIGFAAFGVSRDEDADDRTGGIGAIHLDPKEWRKGYGSALHRGHGDVVARGGIRRRHALGSP